MLRPLLTAGLVIAAVTGGQAAAAPRACNLLTDAAGDANDPLQTGRHAHPALSNPHLDIVGGDFGATSSAVTGVIRLAKAPAFDPRSPQGEAFYLVFTPSVSPRPLFLLAATDMNGKLAYRAGRVDTDAQGSQTFTPDLSVPVRGRLVGSTITMTATASALRPLVSVEQGLRVNAIHAKSFGGAFVPRATGILYAGDTTPRATKPYLVGTSTCVTPVR